jgi:hypothetical protein
VSWSWIDCNHKPSEQASNRSRVSDPATSHWAVKISRYTTFSRKYESNHSISTFELRFLDSDILRYTLPLIISHCRLSEEEETRMQPALAGLLRLSTHWVSSAGVQHMLSLYGSLDVRYLLPIVK